MDWRRASAWDSFGSLAAARNVPIISLAVGSSLTLQCETTSDRERHLAGFGRRKLDGIDSEVKLVVNAVPFDDVKLPRQRAGLLHGNANAIGVCIFSPKRNEGNQRKAQHGFHRASMP